MKLSLYEIEKAQVDVIEQLLANGGELTEEIEQALALNEQNLTTKGTNYGLVVKQLEGECSIIDSEISRLKGLKDARNKTVDKLKGNLETAMKVFGVEEIKSPLLKINFRASKTVEIDHLQLIPLDYIKTTVTTTPDKKAIGDAIKSGIEVPGARVEEHQNLQIK